MNYKDYNKIVVIGLPKSGKTEFVKQFKDREIIHTDAFMISHTWKEQPEAIIYHLKIRGKYIIEGIQCYRLLRTGAKDGTYKPDLIINIFTRSVIQLEHKAMTKTLRKIWRDYLGMCGDKAPLIIPIKGKPNNGS